MDHAHLSQVHSNHTFKKTDLDFSSSTQSLIESKILCALNSCYKARIGMSNSGHQPRSSVAQICNHLSQYLKGNGRLGITAANLETDECVTMNLLSNLENNSTEASSSTSNMIKATDFLQDTPSFASSHFINIDDMECALSQMIIFHNGKVLVFNDISAVKAQEIMALANKSGSSSNTFNSSRAITPDLSMASTPESNNNNNYKQFRKASLHRFFEKRKDRATARAPYQVNTLSSSSSSYSSMAAPDNKPEDQSKCSLLELEGQSSRALDLKL